MWLTRGVTEEAWGEGGNCCGQTVTYQRRNRGSLGWGWTWCCWIHVVEELVYRYFSYTASLVTYLQEKEQKYRVLLCGKFTELDGLTSALQMKSLTLMVRSSLPLQMMNLTLGRDSTVSPWCSTTARNAFYKSDNKLLLTTLSSPESSPHYISDLWNSPIAAMRKTFCTSALFWQSLPCFILHTVGTHHFIFWPPYWCQSLATSMTSQFAAAVVRISCVKIRSHVTSVLMSI